MRRPRSASGLAAGLGVVASLASVACTDGSVSGTQGVGEPILIESAQFIAGSLPGLPPPDASTDAVASPTVTDINVSNTAIAQGEQGLVLTGHATTDAQTVGVRFDELGSGYWVVPLGAPDPSDNGLLTWQMTADFARNIPPGFHNLLFAAVGAGGASGAESALEVCVDTPVPDNLNICVPSRPPPPAVLSLSWDSPVDLGLVVATPSGALLGSVPAAPSTADSGTGASSSATSAIAVLDRESNRNCVIDDIDRDDLVWQVAPESGTYQVWVDLFRACQQPAASFTVSLWLPKTQSDGTQSLIEQTPPVAIGTLTAIQANGGTTSGLFVGSFVLQ